VFVGSMAPWLHGSMGHIQADLDVNDFLLEKRKKSFANGLGPCANSKLANMYFALELKKRLEGTDVFVSVLCPGMVRTNILRYYTHGLSDSGHV